MQRDGSGKSRKSGKSGRGTHMGPTRREKKCEEIRELFGEGVRREV